MKKIVWIIGAIVAVGASFIFGYGLSTEANQAYTPEPVVKTVEPEPLPLTELNLLALVNLERAKVGVGPLQLDETLSKSAQWKADDQAEHGYFGHKRPGETNDNGLDYLKSLRPRCVYASENLAWKTDGSLQTGESAIRWWLQSDKHREAMLDPKYSLTGFGIVHSSIVQHFCQTP